MRNTIARKTRKPLKVGRITFIMIMLSWFSQKGKAQNDSIQLSDGRWAKYQSIKKTDKPKAPLIIGLHGYGMHEQQMATLVNPELSFECHYLSLRGFIPMGKGEYSWFSISGVPEQLEYDEKEIDEVMALLTEFIEKVSTDYQTRDVYLVGYSQGATLLYSYAARAPAVVKGMAAFSGTVLYQPKGKNPGLPFFMGYGSLDHLISHTDMDQSQQYLKQMGIDVDYHSYEVPHVVSKQGRRDLAGWLKGLQKK